jgi:hypothetical protein
MGWWVNLTTQFEKEDFVEISLKLYKFYNLNEKPMHVLLIVVQEKR